jgi:outer membrane protein assembly factor BamB
MKTIPSLSTPTLTFALSASLILAAISNLQANDYPQFRGPQRNAVSAETGLLQEWPMGGPKLLWQVKDVGAGFSTPSVAGERIYLLGNEGLENEFVLALAARDGSRAWSTKLGKVGHPEQNPKYPGARSTPTLDADGRNLYALGSDGDLVCLQAADGSEVWRKHLRTDFGGKYGEWAYAESPLIDGDALICTPGGASATMVALNKRTGEVIWKYAAAEADDATYSSANIAEFSGVKQYVQFLSKGLVGVDAKTGRQLWRYEKTAKGSPAVIITPLVSDGLIYSGAFRATTSVIRPVLKDGVFTTEELYANNKLPVFLGGVVKVGDYFFGSSDVAAMCVEFKSGVVKWAERGPGPCSWMVADKRLYLHAENGDVALIEPASEGFREKGRFTPPGVPDHGNAKAWPHPVVANGRLYIRDLNSLWSYDVRAAK